MKEPAVTLGLAMLTIGGVGSWITARSPEGAFLATACGLLCGLGMLVTIAAGLARDKKRHEEWDAYIVREAARRQSYRPPVAQIDPRDAQIAALDAAIQKERERIGRFQ